MFQLRRLEDDDVEWIFDACQDEAIQRWTLIPRPYSLKDAEWFVENEPEYITMVIEDSESSMPLGLVSIHEIDEVTREAPMGYCYISAPVCGNYGIQHSMRLFNVYVRNRFQKFL